MKPTINYNKRDERFEIYIVSQFYLIINYAYMLICVINMYLYNDNVWNALE